tara:strand:- start:4 stop:405 length:402 start_codon:yes stop_codon:yes gene_type:complete
MAYLSDNEKAILLTDLIDLAKSDGVVNFSEMTYLLWVSQKLGVTQQELTKLMDRSNSAFDRVSPNQRLEQFHRLLNMMFVDTEIDTAELEKCRELAYKMGLDRPKVDSLLSEIAKNPSVMVDLETLKGKFEGR